MVLLLPRTGIWIRCSANLPKHNAPHHLSVHLPTSHQIDEPSDLPPPRSLTERRVTTTRRGLFISSTATAALFLLSDSSSSSYANEFIEVPGSGGVKALDLRTGTGSVPIDGDEVILGIEAAVRSMKVGGIKRVIIPPSQGYQSTSQEPIPPNFFDRQRLFTTIFNPTRIANGEGSTLGTLIFDIELVSLQH